MILVTQRFDRLGDEDGRGMAAAAAVRAKSETLANLWAALQGSLAGDWYNSRQLLNHVRNSCELLCGSGGGGVAIRIA
jgi:hypothetical protein